MRSYLFVVFWWFVVILLYHFEVNFSSFLGSYHFSTNIDIDNIKLIARQIREQLNLK